MSSSDIAIGQKKLIPGEGGLEWRAPICKSLWSQGIDSKDRFRQAGNRSLDSLKGLQIRAQLLLVLLAKRIKQKHRLWRISTSNYFKGCQQRGLIYTEDKPLGRLYKMCNTFFYELRVILSANVFQFVWLHCQLIHHRCNRLEG
jgi:hypothetical protein